VLTRDWLSLADEAAREIAALASEATAALRGRIAADGRVSPSRLEQHQHAAHGLAWLAAYAEALRQLAGHGRRLQEERRFGEAEALLLAVGGGEYCAQVFGGIAMSQGEIVRLSTLGLGRSQIDARRSAAVQTLIAEGNTPENRARLIALMRGQDGAAAGQQGLDDTFEAMRAQVRRFAEAEVRPHAQRWHLDDAYVPMEVIDKLAKLGVFGLTLPEEFGGLGLSRVAMCVVSEELSRAYLGVGSLGTRSEIAAELIIGAGTDEQKARWLPGIAAGEIIPTAVFTEPDIGSDLASVTTRALRSGDKYIVAGNKTWITHAARADLMTMLVRTNPDEAGYKGLSILIGEKPRGDGDPFPVAGLTGTEIEVLGYRGMKEFELAFDGFEVPAANLLGGVEGEGFRQLMRTFETARIQTAARAVGVAQSALDLALRYAEERTQFGKPLIAFPRVADKIAMMAAEINIARQLTYFAARQKDEGKRCDVEAGMAKLLAARAAWSAADNAVQIHGGNGFALEYEVSRVLCDARILNIFEGSAEMQAQVIARRLLEQAN
jgi:(2S)-methylsuccinyl-CoA dehydrogenase